ncbi:neuronal calcium sensor 2 isoform X2 [Apis cerana]|uniref:neuronal calcium sensor 2 isoform X2 n=1 Tax=Apis cerana TaxID=7461 RepID=UPI002B2272B1|nr:neuronal calcium sensor 2 isoform X2 [Apis cerana]
MGERWGRERRRLVHHAGSATRRSSLRLFYLALDSSSAAAAFLPSTTTERTRSIESRSGFLYKNRVYRKMGCFGSKDKLSKEDMDFLKSHTRYDEATIKEWYKGFKQDCPNGRLTPAKFVDMYKMFFPSGNAEEFCDHVFRTFDMDKNGYIDFKEFLLAIDVTSSGTPEEKLKWAFRMYDVDGNGVIDIQEMTKIVQAIYDMLGACSSNRPADSAEERAKNIFARMDENNDGQLTEEEFLKGCLQDEELSKMLAP